jgi:uncharacterized protein Yka (UPF0111/DUF47 family)
MEAFSQKTAPAVNPTFARVFEIVASSLDRAHDALNDLANDEADDGLRESVRKLADEAESAADNIRRRAHADSIGNTD